MVWLVVGGGIVRAFRVALVGVPSVGPTRYACILNWQKVCVHTKTSNVMRAYQLLSGAGLRDPFRFAIAIDLRHIYSGRPPLEAVKGRDT